MRGFHDLLSSFIWGFCDGGEGQAAFLVLTNNASDALVVMNEVRIEKYIFRTNAQTAKSCELLAQRAFQLSGFPAFQPTAGIPAPRRSNSLGTFGAQIAVTP